MHLVLHVIKVTQFRACRTLFRPLFRAWHRLFRKDDTEQVHTLLSRGCFIEVVRTRRSGKGGKRTGRLILPCTRPDRGQSVNGTVTTSTEQCT